MEKMVVTSECEIELVKICDFYYFISRYLSIWCRIQSVSGFDYVLLDWVMAETENIKFSCFYVRSVKKLAEVIHVLIHL